MKYLISLTFSVLMFGLYAQNAEVDTKLLVNHQSEIHQHDGTKFKGLLKIYNRYFSEQIINDCIYEESCSTFSQGAINEYGLIKGGFLSADRLMRCNRASAMDIAPVRINDDGRIKDHWLQYRLK